MMERNPFYTEDDPPELREAIRGSFEHQCYERWMAVQQLKRAIFWALPGFIQRLLFLGVSKREWQAVEGFRSSR